MKTKGKERMLIVLAILPMIIASCHMDYMPGIIGHGDVVQQTLHVDDFEGFVSTVAADIYISQGDHYEVIMEAQQNIIDDLDTDWISNGIWTIKFRHWVKYSKPVKFYITMPTLTKACIAGSGSVVGETPFTDLDNLDLIITGSGRLELDAVSENIDITISGSGDMFLSGEASEFDCLINGSGKIHGFDLILQKADIRVSGSGDAYLSVEEYLGVSISGSGNVFYRGQPEISSHISGSGKIKRDI